MPTYEYLCDGCGHRFDELQSFKDDPLKICPRCKEERLRRLFGTGAAILFKGSGFYETDYRSDSYKKAAKADQEATSAKSNGTSENGSKPAASTESTKSETKASSATT